MASKAADRTKIFILAGLGVVLVAVVALRAFTGAGGTGDAAAASPLPGILAPAPRSELDSDPNHLAAVAKVAQARSGEVYAGDEFRDPMVPLAGVRAGRDEAEDEDGQQPAQAAPITLPSMSLYGIVWDPANPIALIDGNGMHVGETVKGARVVAITVDSVVLSYRSRQFVLTVE